MIQKLVLICLISFLSPMVVWGTFIDNDNGTITDTNTNLMWQKDTAPGTYNWQEAMDYAETFTLLGYNDWRLPNLNELESIVDHTHIFPAIDPIFSDTVLSSYWSSTPLDEDPLDAAWYVDFTLGNAYFGDKSYSGYYVRVVRDEVDFNTINYVALGDSYSAGEGVIPYFDGTDSSPENTCHRSRNAYSALVRTPGHALPLYLFRNVLGYSWDFIACSGAVTDNIRIGGSSPEKGRNEASQLDQFNDCDPPQHIVNEDTDMVTITIGGNDAAFASLITSCFTHDACHNWRPHAPVDNRTNEELFLVEVEGVIKPRLATIYQQIKSRVSEETAIFVLGYPEVLGGLECPDVNLWVLKLSYDEQRFLRSATTILNNAIREAAEEAGVHFVDVQPHFAGHGVCGVFEDWLYGVKAAGAAKFHPTTKGQQEYAKVLNQYLQDKNDYGWPPGILDNGLPKNPPPILGSALSMEYGRMLAEEVPVPWIGELAVEPSQTPPCDTDNIYIPGQEIRINGSGFANGDTVIVRIRLSGGESIVNLGTVLSDDSGHINTIVTIPNETPAQSLCQIEALGKGQNGAGLLLIQMIMIGTSFSDDSDADGIPNICDNCPSTANADQSDTDGDGIGDLCDICPNDFENDADHDGMCAPEDPCPYDADNDVDADGLCANEDNCPIDFNPDQIDSDGDGRGDACDESFCFSFNLSVRPTNCGRISATASNCRLNQFQEGTPISLTAIPEPGFNFTGWTGSISTISNPLTFIMTTDTSLVANFCNDPTDSDGDFMGNLCDNCPNNSNPLQEDSYPPQGNGIGDACECEGNFNCSEDHDVDGSDAFTFKADFGRSTIIHPCIAGDTCNGDFSCDGDVDGTDAFKFKSDFGRSSIQNPCPACGVGEWCQY